MKKYFALLLAGVMALSLAACGGSSSAPAAPAETQKEEAAAEAPAEEKARKLQLRSRLSRPASFTWLLTLHSRPTR